MSFTSPSRDRQPPVIPLASMIDVMFLLLVFFMTASAYREQDQQIDVSLPEATEAVESSGTQIVITVKEDGTIFLTGGSYTFETLKGKLQQIYKDFPKESVVIRGDKDCALGHVVRVMDMVYAAGLRNVYLATTRKQGS